MTQPVDVQRKLRQLDNDVQSIYEMLASISATQVRQGNRLGEIEAKLGDLDAKLGDLDAKIGGMDTMIGGMDTKLDTIVGLLGDQRTG